MATLLNLSLTLYSLIPTNANNCEFRIYDHADESGIASANGWQRITVPDLQNNVKYKHEFIDYLNSHQGKVTPIASWNANDCQILYNSNQAMVLNKGHLFEVDSCENMIPNTFYFLLYVGNVYQYSSSTQSIPVQVVSEPVTPLAYMNEFDAGIFTLKNNNPAFYRKCYEGEYEQICVTDNYRPSLDGVYHWWYFNTITNSSVYYCDKCNKAQGAYLHAKFIERDAGDAYYFIFGENLWKNSSLSVCKLGPTLPSNFINFCDGKWITRTLENTLKNDTVNLEACVHTTTTASTTTSVTTSTTTSRSTTDYQTESTITTTECGYALNKCISIGLFHSEYYECDELGGFIHKIWNGTNDCNETRLGNTFHYKMNWISSHECCESSSKGSTGNIQSIVALFIIEFIIYQFIF